MKKKAISNRLLILSATGGVLTLFTLLPAFHEACSQSLRTTRAGETGARSASTLEPTVEILEPLPNSVTGQYVIPVVARYGPGVVVVATRVNRGPWQILPQADGVARGELKLSSGQNFLEFQVLNELWALHALSFNVRMEADEIAMPSSAVAEVAEPEAVVAQIIEPVEVMEEMPAQEPDLPVNGEGLPEEAAITDATELPEPPTPEIAESVVTEEIAAPEQPEQIVQEVAEAVVTEPAPTEEELPIQDTVITETNLRESELDGGDIWAVEVLLDRLDASDVVPLFLDDLSLSDIDPIISDSDLSGYIDSEQLYE